MVASSKYTAPKEDDTSAIIIPTKTDVSPNPAHEREIDLSQMDEQDVKSLHKSDPFMYYSIPGVLKASLTLKDVDYSDITSLCHDDSHTSSPPRSQEEAENDAGKVSRRTCVSFESHPSVLMEDLMNELDQEFGDQLNDLDDIVSMFRNRSYSSKR
eukprot:scaffold1290_cov112-Skeletonema_dohrnii-CCMP3373.AAC.10